MATTIFQDMEPVRREKVSRGCRTTENQAGAKTATAENKVWKVNYDESWSHVSAFLSFATLKVIVRLACVTRHHFLLHQSFGVHSAHTHTRAYKLFHVFFARAHVFIVIIFLCHHYRAAMYMCSSCVVVRCCCCCWFFLSSRQVDAFSLSFTHIESITT